MTKTELVTAMAEKSGVSKADTEKSLKAFIEVVQDALKSGDKVQLVGFGTFEVQDKPARQARNPRTGQMIDVAASKSPKFKAGKALKDYIN